jgi:hypothetical protein
MILEFKTKIADGFIKRPKNFTIHHIADGSLYNQSQFDRFLWKLYKKQPELRLPRTFTKTTAPNFVTIDDSRFLAVITIDYTLTNQPPTKEVYSRQFK